MGDLTKGPWHWREGSGLDHRGEGRKLILEGADGRIVCDFGEVRGGWAGESSGEEPFGADAKLLEASYDLLVALIAARRAMTNERYNKPRIGMEAACALADAAWLKATGEEWPYGSHEILSTLKIADHVIEVPVVDAPKPTLREAACSLYESFEVGRGPGMHPYIQSIGEADNTGVIRVYLVRKPQSHERAIPESWEGWSIATKVVGRITIG